MPNLSDIVVQVRRDILRMVHQVNSGHPGGSLGCTEFMVTLYFKIMNVNKEFTMDGKNEDLFLKGGMTLEIEITTDNILAYEMSPVHLSVNSDGVLYTKIVKNDEVTYKNVTIVNSGENLVNVTGLNDGDIVLTNGQAFVSLNDKIQYNIEN